MCSPMTSQVGRRQAVRVCLAPLRSLPGLKDEQVPAPTSQMRSRACADPTMIAMWRHARTRACDIVRRKADPDSS